MNIFKETTLKQKTLNNKKTIKIFKSFYIVLFFFFVMFSLQILPVFAADTTYYNDDKSYNFTSTEEKVSELYTGTTFTSDHGYTTRGQTKTEQDVFVLKQKSDASQGIKTVTWAIYDSGSQSSHKAFERKNLGAIAEDYEKNHPGWKVLGGINADQYFFNYGTKLGQDGSDIFVNQPYYPMIADGENWFTYNATGENSNVVGFTNDPTKNAFVYGARQRTGFKLYVYDENKQLIGKFPIDYLNPDSPNKPSTTSNSTVLYALYNQDKEGKSTSSATTSMDVTSTNDLFIVSNAEKAFVSNSRTWSWYKTSAIDAFFGKGTIDLTAKQTTLKTNQFAIDTTNQELKNVLKVGSYVMAQYEFDDEMEVCDEGIGFHTVQRQNNKDNNVANSYNSRAYPRSVFGFTSDGSTILLTCNGGTAGSSHGLYAQEINAVLKKYDVTDAFQMDGGGSVTMVVRNDKGKFDTVTKGSDGNDRSILSGLFFVVRDIQADITPNVQNTNSIEMNVKINDNAGRDIDKVYLQLVGKNSSGKTETFLEEVVNEKVTFNNLSSNSSFTYKLFVQYKGNTNKSKTFQEGTVRTAKLLPSVLNAQLNFKDGSYVISVNVKDDDNAITDLDVSFDGGETYNRLRTNYVSFEGTVDNFNTDNPLGNLVIFIRYRELNNGDVKTITLQEDEVKWYYTSITFIESLKRDIDKSINNIF